MFDEKELKFFDRYGKTRPEHHPHETDSWESPIGQKLQRLNPTNWRMEGNKLIADTDMGKLCQFISPDYILTGTDAQGMPVLKKLAL